MVEPTVPVEAIMALLVAPSSPSAAANLASTLLGPLSLLGPGRTAGLFEQAASAIAGPINRLQEFSSTPLLPNFVVSLHSSGQVVFWCGGVDLASQASAFLGLLPDSSFHTLGGANDSVSSYAINLAAKVQALSPPAFSPAFAIGHSLGGAALAKYVGGLGQASAVDMQCALSVGAPKPGSSFDFSVVGPPRFYRFWTPPDPVVTLPPAIQDAPIAAGLAGPLIAYNWNQQVQAGGGQAVESGSALYPSTGGRSTPASNAANIALLLSGGSSSPATVHSLANYINLLGQSFPAGLKPDLEIEADTLSKPQLFLTPQQVQVLLRTPGYAAQFLREFNMVPRVIIPADALPTTESYLGSTAVYWQGQVIGTFEQKYMGKILVREIAKMMRRTSLMSGLDQAAWTAAVTSWVSELQSIGGGYSPQPPAL